MQKNMCNMYLNMRNMYMYIAYYDEYMMYIYNVGIQRMGFHHFITLSQVNLLVGSTSLCWVFFMESLATAHHRSTFYES